MVDLPTGAPLGQVARGAADGGADHHDPCPARAKDDRHRCSEQASGQSADAKPIEDVPRGPSRRKAVVGVAHRHLTRIGVGRPGIQGRRALLPLGAHVHRRQCDRGKSTRTSPSGADSHEHDSGRRERHGQGLVGHDHHENGSHHHQEPDELHHRALSSSVHTLGLQDVGAVTSGSQVTNHRRVSAGDHRLGLSPRAPGVGERRAVLTASAAGLPSVIGSGRPWPSSTLRWRVEA